MRSRSLTPFLTVSLAAGLAWAHLAQTVPPAKKPLTLERLTGEPPLLQRGMSGARWRDGGRLTYLLPDGTGREAPSHLWEVDAATRKKTKLLEPIPLEPAATDTRKEAKPKTLSLSGYQWNPAGTAILLSGENDLFLYDFGAKEKDKALRRLTRDADEEQYPVFSPDGSNVAYVKKNDLFTVDVATGKETRLSATGAEHVLNGKLDWVYEEELANRRSGRSFEWAPDGKAIVYLRLDENRVPEYPIVDFLPTNGKLVPQRYPKAGDPNAIPSVHIVELPSAESPATDTSISFNPDDLYVAPELSWTADSKAACFLKLNRAQTRAEVTLLPRGGGGTRTLLVESDPAWINSIEPPVFLRDGSGFLFVSERTGFFHLYRYGMDGQLKNAVTSGSWMLDRSPELDETSGRVFFTATEKDVRERHVYRVNLDGTSFARLSDGRGVHSIDLAPGGAFYVDSFSDIENPPKRSLRKADGTEVALLDEPKGELFDHALARTELSSFKGSDGTLFYTRLVKPIGFDPAKKYPVVVDVYGGPHAQVVQDRWGGTSLFDQLLASKGFVVFSMDNRGSWGRGHAFETPILKKAGETELKDQLEGIAWLKTQPFVDGGRIGIWGWSYGGYMTLYAATHAGDTFRCAVAGAPVVDWKYYDSIYTERYMKLPKENPEGYKSASPLEAADKMGTKLLILHGTSDDNVHIQNTMAFVDRLIRARKDFTFVPIPRAKHGPREPAARLYVHQRILEFFEKNL